MADKIIVKRKSNGKTGIRLEKDLLKDLKDFTTKTEYENLSLQALVDLAVRRFILTIEPKEPKEPN